MAGEVGRAYREQIRGRPVEASVAATLAYIAALVVVRAFTTASRGAQDAPDLSIAGVHLHHEVFGIVAILVAGVFALDEVFRIQRAVLFGIGAALVLDEFALVVFLKDVYWLPPGSLSIAAIGIGVVALVVNAWRGRTFLRSTGSVLRRRFGRGPTRARRRPMSNPRAECRPDRRRPRSAPHRSSAPPPSPCEADARTPPAHRDAVQRDRVGPSS